jgi:hypothetical protein
MEVDQRLTTSIHWSPRRPERAGWSAVLDFPPNATHKMCCNMPYLVAIDTIATKLFCGPWDAKGHVALGYCNVVHQVVAKVFLFNVM